MAHFCFLHSPLIYTSFLVTDASLQASITESDIAIRQMRNKKNNLMRDLVSQSAERCIVVALIVTRSRAVAF